MTIEKAFEAADRIAVLAIRCIADAILRSGLVYPDPAEILDMLRQAGAAGFGTGAAGIGRPIEEAIQKALYSPSLGLSGHPADKILLRLSCSDGISFREMAEAMEHARQMLGNHTELYFGVQTGEIPDGFAEASAIAVWH